MKTLAVIRKDKRQARKVKPIVRLAFKILRGFTCGLLFFLTFPLYASDISYPQNLWEGLIAEDTGGDYQVYLHITSCVRNRLTKGMNHGLVALQRQNLRQFVKENCDYILKVKGIDLTKLTTKAIQEVFISDKDYCNGATHYEHTQIYPIPAWAKDMQMVKILYKGTKKEITFWKE